MTEQLKTLQPRQIQTFFKSETPNLVDHQQNTKVFNRTHETSKLRQRFSPDLKYFTTNQFTNNSIKNDFRNKGNNQNTVNIKNRTMLTRSTIIDTQNQGVNNAELLQKPLTKTNTFNKKAFSPMPTTNLYSESQYNDKTKRNVVSPKRHSNLSSEPNIQNSHGLTLHSEQKGQNRCPSFFKKAKIAEQIKREINFQQTKKISNLTVLDFKFVKFLGQGTFGDVYLAVHKKTNSLFTIKRYRKDTINSHQLQQKFVRDIKIQSRINHPNIVKMYGFYDDQTFVYIIFQYMHQGNLWKMNQQRGGKISQGQITKKVVQINSALLYLHQKNIIHRDIKPQSILLCHSLCKLCDTEWIQSDKQISSNMVLCRQIDYTAPQALQGKQISSNFDIWGLGLVTFEMVTGKKLFNAVTQKGILRKIITIKSETIQKQLPEGISRNLKQFILQALNPVSSKRIQSIELQKLQIFQKHVKQRKWLGQQSDQNHQE